MLYPLTEVTRSSFLYHLIHLLYSPELSLLQVIRLLGISKL
jgi:hypothetical protein